MQAGSYTDGYSGACPGAKGWRDYLRFWIADKYVKQYGVDAWYLDSFPVTMFGSARVCFSPLHGDGRPHGVGPALLEFTRELRERAARTVPLAITSESVNDLFMRYNSHALGLELVEGLTAWPKPEIYTYTFPHHTIFSGTCNGAGSGLHHYYPELAEQRGSRRAETLDRVFLMGYRFDVLGYKLDRASPDMLYLRDLIALRQRIKAELYASSFVDELGLGTLPPGVIAKVFRHDGAKSVSVVFLDRRAKRDAFTLRLHPAAWSTGELNIATLFTLDGAGRELPLSSAPDGLVSVDIPAREARPAALVLRRDE
jgi:hypothetical protein